MKASDAFDRATRSPHALNTMTELELAEHNRHYWMLQFGEAGRERDYYRARLMAVAQDGIEFPEEYAAEALAFVDRGGLR